MEWLLLGEFMKEAWMVMWSWLVIYTIGVAALVVLATVVSLITNVARRGHATPASKTEAKGSLKYEPQPRYLA